MTQPASLIQAETAAHAQLEAVVTQARQAQESLRLALTQAHRYASLAQFDSEALNAFLEKPYVVRPLGKGQVEEIMEGRAMTGAATLSRLRTAAKALAGVGLLYESHGRYQVNPAEIKRLQSLGNFQG